MWGFNWKVGMEFSEFWLGSVAEKPRKLWVRGAEPRLFSSELRPAKENKSQQGSEAGAGHGACWFPGRPSLWN